MSFPVVAMMVKTMSKRLRKAPVSAQKVDARSSDPVLNAKRGIASAHPGEIVEVLTNDVSLDDVLPIWALKTGHRYLGHMPANGCEHLFLRRGA